jgi:hypothetical protein
MPNLSDFWPLDAPPRKWKVILRADRGFVHPRRLMWVENETIGPGRFILWFSHKKNGAPDDRVGERYHLCRLPGMSWLWFDAYLSTTPRIIEHRVVSDRILFTPSGGPATDLIKGGLYNACGATGQPYLVWSGGPRQYRLQVWGHLTENPKLFKWYGDALVTGPEAIVDDCLQPVERRSAIRYEEAWWASFKNPSGAWGIGSGQIDAQTGMPTGSGVVHGRTVWHGAGQLPYFVFGPGQSPSNPRACVSEVTPLPQGR